MGFETGVYLDVLVLRWPTPLVDDVEAMRKALHGFSETRDAVHVMVVLPPQRKALSPSVRDGLSQMLAALGGSCTTLCLVVEGDGFERAGVRAVAAATLAAEADRVFVTGSFTEALRHTQLPDMTQQTVMTYAKHDELVGQRA